VAAIQGNQPEDLSAPGGDDLSILENHASLTRRLESDDISLIVWPEGAAGSDPLETPELREPLISTIESTAVPFLVGTRVEVDDEHFRNRSLFFNESGELIAHYDKIRLVPFGEFVPGRRWLVPIFEQLERVPKDGIPGTSMTLFEISEGEFGSVICFESTFPDLVGRLVKKGAGLVAVITDNGSFERTAASRQHLMFSQLRAAENRIWIVHAALSGISGFVAPDGNVVAPTDLFEPARLVQTVRFANRQTLYTRLGDWFPIACVALLGVFLVVGARSRLRRNPSTGPIEIQTRV
jgi:apolipoprotein N-acyltransferase